MKLKKGFTILEITIVIFIMMLLFTITMVNYRRDRESLSLWKETSALKQDIRMVQIMTGREEINCKDNGEYHSDYFYGYGFYIDEENPQRYIIFADCNGNISYNPEEDWIIKEVSLQTEIESFTPSSGGSLHIVFYPPGPQAVINGMDTEAEIIIRSRENETERKLIRVNTVGRIQSEKIEI